MWRRSKSLRLDDDRLVDERSCNPRRWSSIRKIDSCERIKARSITFANSRTLPGQE